MSEEKLSHFLKTGSNWSRMKTTVPGVVVLKMSAYGSSPTRLAVKLDPVEDGKTPTKRRGISA